MNIIVVGCGRVGAQLATMLSEQGNNVTVIDKNEDAFSQLGGTFNGVTIKGLGFDEDTLLTAGIQECDYFCAVTDLDNTNVMATQVATYIFGVENVVTRLYNPGRTATYERLELDYVCGTNLVAEAIFDKVVSSNETHIKSFGDVEIFVFKVADRFIGTLIRSIEIEGKVLPSIVRRGSHTFIPTRESTFERGDILRVAVSAGSVRKLKKYMED